MPRRHHFPSLILPRPSKSVTLTISRNTIFKAAKRQIRAKRDYAYMAWTVSQRGSTEWPARKANSMKPGAFAKPRGL